MFLIYSYLITNLSFVVLVNFVLISVDWLFWCLSFSLQQVGTPFVYKLEHLRLFLLFHFAFKWLQPWLLEKLRLEQQKKPNKINVSKMKERTKRDTERWRIVEFVDLLKEGGTMQRDPRFVEGYKPLGKIFNPNL